MTTSMDGATVTRGDTVYDLTYGAGVVKYLYDDNRGAVQFGGLNGVIRTFDFPTGVAVNGVLRTLYWSQPTIIAPTKSRKGYDAFHAAMAALAALVLG